MKNRDISNERRKYLNSVKLNKFLVILTQILVLVRFFGNLGITCKCKYN